MKRFLKICVFVLISLFVFGPVNDQQITIDQILSRMEQSAENFNASLEDLIVKQTITTKATLAGKTKTISEIRFTRPDSVEQTVVEEIRKERKGAEIEAEERVKASLFTDYPLSLSIKDYKINLIREEKIRDRMAYLLKVEPKDENGDFVNGKIWVDSEDFTIVRVESKLIKKEERDKLGKGKRILEYSKFDNKYWLPILNRMEGRVLVFIKVVSEITYTDYKINIGGTD